MVNQGPDWAVIWDMSCGTCGGPSLHTQMGSLPVSSFPRLAAPPSAVPAAQLLPRQCSVHQAAHPTSPNLSPLLLGTWEKGQAPLGNECKEEGWGMAWWQAWSAQIVFSGIEACLGRTGKVKSGSDGQQGQSSAP